MPAMSVVEGVFCRSTAWRTCAGRWVLPWALQGVRPTGDVLELGGGSGAMAEQLLRNYPGVRLTVTDVDPRMVARSADRLSGCATASAVEADATALAYPDASFDMVLSFLMLHHVIAWERAIREAARVLRPGGVLVGYDLLDRPAARAVHLLDRSPHKLVGRGELEAELAAAGLSVDALQVSLAGQVVRFTAHRPA